MGRSVQPNQVLSQSSSHIVQFFTCGSGKIANAIKSKLVDVIKDIGKVGDDEAAAKFARITQGRYVADVFD
jgi:cytochrome P450/NADPH-cytochrome P450 reductase